MVVVMFLVLCSNIAPIQVHISDLVPEPLYIYIYNMHPSQSIIDASIDCTIGKMVQLISQSFLWAATTGADCKFAH